MAEKPSQVAQALQAIKPSSATMASASLGIPLGIVVVWIVKMFLPEAIEMPSEVATSIGAIVAAVAGMFFSGGTSETST